MDILHKELDAIYLSQNLSAEELDYTTLDLARGRVADLVGITNACAVITDISADTCHIFSGSFGRLLGIASEDSSCRIIHSSDEDIIYNRIHPEDLVEKRMLEYEFFKFADTLPPAEKRHYKATCSLRIRDCHNDYIRVDNSTQILALSPAGKFWLVLCCYDLSPSAVSGDGISPRIVSNRTGEIVSLSFAGRRARVLSPREKEILSLIHQGMLSKQIAARLGISVHTVNRHRQNILEKLSVGNSVEAVVAAQAMKLL